MCEYHAYDPNEISRYTTVAAIRPTVKRASCLHPTYRTYCLRQTPFSRKCTMRLRRIVISDIRSDVVIATTARAYTYTHTHILARRICPRTTMQYRAQAQSNNKVRTTRFMKGSAKFPRGERVRRCFFPIYKARYKFRSPSPTVNHVERFCHSRRRGPS